MKFIGLILVTLLLSANPAVAEEPLRVLDQGMDGSARYYTITCPDGTYSSVVVHYNLAPATITGEQRAARLAVSVKPPEIIQVCTFADSGTQCKPQWDLEDAAKASCP